MAVFTPALIRVLVVDDDESVRESLSRFLSDRDFQVETVGTAAQALAFSRAHSYDFAIVDIRLPDFDGDQLLPQLSALLPNANFLVYTGSTSFVVTPELTRFKFGPKQVFHKPVQDMSVFIKAMQDLWQDNRR